MSPSLLTFGVELEFLVACLYDGEEDPDAKLANIPPPYRISGPRYDEYRRKRVTDMFDSPEAECVREHIRQTLHDHGVPVEPTRYNPDVKTLYPHSEDFDKRRMAQYVRWTVKYDSSISESSPQYEYCPVEITSPITNASASGFEQVRYVVNLLSSKYRLRISPNCGLHVSVGIGPGTFDRTAIQRIAGLLYAADPLLGTLHPPWRHFSRWGQSIREKSNLARGTISAQEFQHYDPGYCGEWFGREVRHGELPILWREKVNMLMNFRRGFLTTRRTGHFMPLPSDWEQIETLIYRGNTSKELQQVPEPHSNLDTDSFLIPPLMKGVDNLDVSNNRYVSCRPRSIPRIAPRTFTADEAEILQRLADGEGWRKDSEAAEKDLGAFHGIAHLFAAETSCFVRELLYIESSERPNYNFSAFECLSLNETDTCNRRIEFREAAGSVNGCWVTTWARIVVGLSTWGIHAPVDDYLRIISHCHESVAGVVKYDVLDLLDEMGLYVEAAIVEDRLKDHMEEWGLQYEAES